MNSRTVIIPAGNIWMRIAFEQFLQKFIDLASLKGPLLQVTNPWYMVYQRDAIDCLRTALLGGEITAYYCDDDGTKNIPKGYWRRDVSTLYITEGEFFVGEDQKEFVFLETSEFRKFCEIYTSGSWPIEESHSADSAHNPEYTTPFISMMMEAIRVFGIPDKSPKKTELVDFFISKKLPDGSPVSRNHAESMATFCRPPEAMKGGNKRIGS